MREIYFSLKMENYLFSIYCLNCLPQKETWKWYKKYDKILSKNISDYSNEKAFSNIVLWIWIFSKVLNKLDFA